MDLQWIEVVGTAGATGEVWHARDRDCGNRDVAVKFFHPNLGILREQVRKHVDTLARVDHPNIVKVFGVHDLKRPNKSNNPEVLEPAIVMEFVPGQTFGDWLNKPELNRQEVESVIEGILAAIEELHNRGLVHGDIHGHNIHILNGVAKILDPVAHDPNAVLSTQSITAKKWNDIHFLKPLIGQALAKVNPNTAMYGAFFFASTQETTVAELREHARSALRAPSQSPQQRHKLMPISSFYDACRNAQASQDRVQWQELRKGVLRTLQPQFNSWRHERNTLGRSVAEIESAVAACVLNLGDLIAFGLAAAESPYPEFVREHNLIRRLLAAEWPISGETTFVEIPRSMAFVFTHLFGATACANGNGNAAIDLCLQRITNRYDSEKQRPLLNDAGIMGWPKSLNGDCRSAFKFLLSLYETIPPLRSVFSDQYSYTVSLGAFGMIASLLQHAKLSRDKAEEKAMSDRIFPRTVAPTFVYLNSAEYSEAASLAFEDTSNKARILEAVGISESELDALWPVFATDSLKYNQESGFLLQTPAGLQRLPWST